MKKQLKCRTIISGIVLAVLMLIIVLQGSYIWKDYARIQLGIVKRYVWITAAERSKILILKKDPASYLKFLNQLIPQNAQVVLPPEKETGDLQRQKWFADQNMMQFFLFPRMILLCDQDINSDCVENLNNPKSYILAFGNFPPPEFVEAKQFVPFPASIENIKGVYIPSESGEQIAIPTVDDYSQWTKVPLIAYLIDTVILISLLTLGFIFVSLFIPGPNWLDIFSLSFPLAMGIISWCTFMSSYLGASITLLTYLFWFMLLLIIGIGVHFLLRKSWPKVPRIFPIGSPRQIWKNNAIAVGLGLGVFLWFGLNGLISIGHGYSTFDEIANWALKGYAMAYKHSIWASNYWGGHVMAYPMNIQLLISLFSLADGDAVPGSKAIFPIMTISLLIGCYQFWRKHEVKHNLALIGILFIFTTPFFFRYSTMGYANGPFTAYLVLGVLWSIEGLLHQDNRSILLGGLLFAFAGWTRPEGIGYSLILLACIWICSKYILKVRVDILQIGAALLPIVFVPLTWLILIGAKNMQQDQIGGALITFKAMLSGNINFEAWGVMYTYAKQYFSWWHEAGYILPIAIIIAVVSIAFNRWYKNKLILSLCIITLVTAMVPAAMFYIDSFSEGNFPLFLVVSFNRAYLPAVIMVVITLIMILDTTLKPKHTSLDNA